MRDPARIKRILGKLQEYWRIYPDLRFFQSLYSITRTTGDMFYLEDDEFEKQLDKAIKEAEKDKKD